MNTQITTDTHTREMGVLFLVHCQLFLITRISFYEYSLSLQTPLSLPRDVRSDLKEAEQKYQCAICENKQKKNKQKVVQFSFKFFFFHLIILLL